jgi:hypothetical protein
MTHAIAPLDSEQLRERLMAAEPMQRVAALHALECEVTRSPNPPGGRLAQAVGEFVSRGMPFYSCVDPHYLEWVDRAVQYLERLRRHSSEAPSPGRERRSSARLAGHPA